MPWHALHFQNIIQQHVRPDGFRVFFATAVTCNVPQGRDPSFRQAPVVQAIPPPRNIPRLPLKAQPVKTKILPAGCVCHHWQTRIENGLWLEIWLRCNLSRVRRGAPGVFLENPCHQFTAVPRTAAAARRPHHRPQPEGWNAAMTDICGGGGAASSTCRTPCDAPLWARWRRPR